MTQKELKASVERYVTKLLVPHEGKLIPFVAHPEGPDTRDKVGRKLIKKYSSLIENPVNTPLPSGDRLASLVYAAHCSPEVRDEPEFANMRDLMNNNRIFMFNVNFWTPEGVYVCHDPYLREGYTSTDIIEDRLKHGSRELSNGIRISAAESVRFAPKETYKPGEHTPDSLAKDGFMIASFGEEGAQKIAEVISRNNSSGNISVYRPVPANSLPHPRNRNETFSFIDLDTDNKRFDLLGHNPCEWMTGYAFASL